MKQGKHLLSLLQGIVFECVHHVLGHIAIVAVSIGADVALGGGNGLCEPVNFGSRGHGAWLPHHLHEEPSQASAEEGKDKKNEECGAPRQNAPV